MGSKFELMRRKDRNDAVYGACIGIKQVGPSCRFRTSCCADNERPSQKLRKDAALRNRGDS